MNDTSFVIKPLRKDLHDHTGVERMGVVLEPETDYEKSADGRGGCEDPRITYIPACDHYVMTYTAFFPVGPRIAFAMDGVVFPTGVDRCDDIG